MEKIELPKIKHIVTEVKNSVDGLNTNLTLSRGMFVNWKVDHFLSFHFRLTSSGPEERSCLYSVLVDMCEHTMCCIYPLPDFFYNQTQLSDCGSFALSYYCDVLSTPESVKIFFS